MILAMSCATVAGKMLEKATAERSARAEKHSQLVSETVSAIKAIKYNGWEEHFNRTIRQAKRSEMDAVQRCGRLLTIVNASANPSVDLISLVVVLLYIFPMGNTLTPATLAAYWVLLALLHGKIFEFPGNVRAYSEGKASLAGFQDFLSRPEVAQAAVAPAETFAEETREDATTAPPATSAELQNAPAAHIEQANSIPPQMPQDCVRQACAPSTDTLQEVCTLASFEFDWQQQQKQQQNLSKAASVDDEDDGCQSASKPQNRADVQLRQIHCHVDCSAKSTGHAEQTAGTPEEQQTGACTAKACLGSFSPAHLCAKEAAGQSEGDGKDRQLLLAGVDLVVHRGDLIGVCGQVGSGKSTMLLALLGEIKPQRGTAHIAELLKERVALVAQTAWVFTGTLRDNVVMDAPWDERWYKQVCDACALTRDIALLAKGDSTLIGERGVNISV